MKFAHQIVVFDAADLGTESRFWAGLLGGTVEEEGFQVYADPAGHPFCLCWLLSRGAPECGRTIIERPGR